MVLLISNRVVLLVSDEAGSGGGGVGELDRKHINDRGGINGSSTGLVK